MTPTLEVWCSEAVLFWWQLNSELGWYDRKWNRILLLSDVQ